MGKPPNMAIPGQRFELDLDAPDFAFKTLDEAVLPDLSASLAVNDIQEHDTDAVPTAPSLRSSKSGFPEHKRRHISTFKKKQQAVTPSPRYSAPTHIEPSVASTMGLPWQGAYNSSKAAIANFSETMRLEFQPFGIKVIDLKTGAVKTPFFENLAQRYTAVLPEDSVYMPIKDKVEKVMNGDFGGMEPQDVNKWAKNVVSDLSKRHPSAHIWRGTSATLAWIGTFLPVGTFDSMARKITGTDILEKKLKEEGSRKAK